MLSTFLHTLGRSDKYSRLLRLVLEILLSLAIATAIVAFMMISARTDTECIGAGGDKLKYCLDKTYEEMRGRTDLDLLNGVDRNRLSR